MVGESETPSEYHDEFEWEKLLDSGILEDLIQKAEHENAVKRATQVTQAENFPDCEILETLVQKAEHESAVKRATTQVVPSFSTPQTLVPLSNIPVDPSFQPSCILSTSLPAAQASGTPQLQTENAFNIRSQAFNGQRKPPLPFELRGSQGYYQDRYEGTNHLPTNLSQLPTQTPGSFRYGTPVHVNGGVSTSHQPSNGVSGLHRDGGLYVNEQLAEKNGTISALRSKLQQVNCEEVQYVVCVQGLLL